MFIYRFENSIGAPIEEALVIADNEEEATKIVSEGSDHEGWELDEKFEIKKGLLFIGDADC